MDLNKQMNKTYNDILTVLNQSGLPIGCVVFILKDVMNLAQKGYEQALQLSDKKIDETEAITLDKAD